MHSFGAPTTRRPLWRPVGTPVRRRSASPLRGTVIGLFIAFATTAVPATAAQATPKSANPNHTTTGASSNPLGLVSATTSTNPNSPPWCLTEDDYVQRVYSGALNGSYSTSEELCGLATDYYNGVYWDSGGIGLQSTVFVVGALTDMTITSPTGAVEHAVWVGSSISKGTTTNEYEACFMPTYSISTGTGGLPLSVTDLGDPWSVTLSGDIASAKWYVTAQMGQVPYQEASCPASEQNLVP